MNDFSIIPKELRGIPGFTGSRTKRPEGISYIYRRSKTWASRNFNAIELAKAIGISERGALKMLNGFVQMGYMTSKLVRIDIPVHLQQFGITHIFRRSFYIVSNVIKSLFSFLYKKVSSATVLEYTNKNNTPAKIIKSLKEVGGEMFIKCVGWMEELTSGRKNKLSKDELDDRMMALMHLDDPDFDIRLYQQQKKLIKTYDRP